MARQAIIGLQVCHSGANADADLAPVRALGNPIVDLVGPKPYTAVQSMLNAMEPKWLHRYWKTEFLPDLRTIVRRSSVERSAE